MVRPFDTVAIIGMGLIGGSMALASVERGYRVIGYNRSPNYRTMAEQKGIETADSIQEAVKDADLVVLAIPLPIMGQVGAQVAQFIKPAATVIDIGSVKAPVREALDAAGLGKQYIATHPMAGNEHSGFVAADKMLLKGAPWAMTTPDGGITPDCKDRYELVYQYLTDTFDANIIEISDQEHDTVQALISGLPHVLAVQLLNQAYTSPQRELAFALAAGSFRDGTRVAYTDPARTKALVEGNRLQVASQIRDAVAHLTQLADQLEANQDTTDFFQKANPLRKPQR